LRQMEALPRFREKNGSAEDVCIAFAGHT
jgi:hypothetical protein